MRIDKRLKSGRVKTGLHAENGLSVAEVVIAMVLFLGITGTIWSLMQVGLKLRNTTNQNVQLGKTVRVGLNLVSRDTQNAGLGYPADDTVIVPNNTITNLLVIPPDNDPLRDKVPPIITGNNITLNTFNTAPNVRTDQITFLFKDTTFNLVGNAADPTQRWVPQPLITDRPIPGGTQIRSQTNNAPCATNDLYLVTAGGTSRLGLATGLSNPDTINFANGDVLGLNLSGSANSLNGFPAPALSASVLKVQMVTFFVTPDGTLMRRQYVNVPPVVPAVGWVDEPLVYNVENFQIQYVMNDGSLSDNPLAGPDLAAGTADDTWPLLSLIRQVRYTISVRSTEMGPNNQPYRETMTVTVSTKNLGYDAS